MTTAYISVGSNIAPEVNIPAALRLLRHRAGIIAVSNFYRSKAIGPENALPFYNGVVAIETDLEPRELKFELLRKIENACGRTRTSDKYTPRTIDLDIIVYGDLAINEPDLVIPDPDILTRSFLAAPLLELAPDLVLPGAGTKLRDVARSMQMDAVLPLYEFTRALREEILNES